MLFSQPVPTNAQTRNKNPSPKIEKTLETGADGFKYYKIKKGNLAGVEDLDGNILVPILYDNVYYIVDSDYGTHFFKTKKDPYVGAYSPEGKEIIPIDRKYTSIRLYSPLQDMGGRIYANSGFVYFTVERNGGMKGICDASGTEVIPPTRKYSSLFFNRASEGYPKYNPIDVYYITAKEGDKYLKLDINGIVKGDKKPEGHDPDFDVKTSYNYFSESLYWPFTMSSDYSTSKSSTSSVSSTYHTKTNNPVSVKYHYTKSGRGQSQNTGQWTDAIASEECEVEFFDDYITVNGVTNQFVKNSGPWKVYGGQSMGWSSNNTIFYYYVDANKNMKQVCELTSPYGFDTFIYPMSMNGDPTPHNNPTSTSCSNNSTSSSSNSNSSSSQTSNRFKCAYCNGTGMIEKNDNAPATYGQNQPRQKCSTCGKWYDPGVFTHYHQQCRHCGGTGYTK